MEGYLKPLITEKSLELAKKNWYSFRAPVKMTKNELKELIEKTFGVNVLTIRTVRMKGKIRRSLTRRTYKRLSDWKKVVVLLKEGQKIDLFETGV